MLYQLRKAADVCSTLWFACSYAAPTPNTYTPRSTGEFVRVLCVLRTRADACADE